MEGIGWLIITIAAIVIFIKIRNKRCIHRCPVCGEIVKKPVIHDKLTGEYYHPEHWLEYTKQEILNELRNGLNSPRYLSNTVYHPVSAQTQETFDRYRAKK